MRDVAKSQQAAAKVLLHFAWLLPVIMPEHNLTELRCLRMLLCQSKVQHALWVSLLQHKVYRTQEAARLSPNVPSQPRMQELYGGKEDSIAPGIEQVTNTRPA